MNNYIENLTDSHVSLLKGQLTTLVPILLDSMIYREDDKVTQLLCMDDEDEEQCDIDKEVLEEWSVRKSAAETLETMSAIFKDEITTFIISQVEERLNVEMKWSIREAAVLALGAIAVGFTMREDLMKQLLELLSDSDVSQKLFLIFNTIYSKVFGQNYLLLDYI